MKKWTLLLSFMLALSACTNSQQNNNIPNTPNQEAPLPADTDNIPQPEAAPQTSKYVDFVNKNGNTLAAFAMKFASSDDLGKEIQKLVEADKKGPVALLQQTDLKEIYTSRDFKPIFLDNNQLASSLSPLVEELQQLDLHGLSSIDVSKWVDARNALDEASQSQHDAFVFTDEESAKLAQILTDRNIDIDDPNAVKNVISELVQDENTLPRLNQAVKERAKNMTKSAQQAALVEVLTADLSMRFARAMTFDNMTHLTDEETASLGKKPTHAKYKAVAAKRTRAWFDSLAAVMDAPAPGLKEKSAQNGDETAQNDAAEAPKDVSDDNLDEAGDAHAAETEAANAQANRVKNATSVADLVEALYPPHPAYKQLMEARKKYASLEDWKDIPQTQLKYNRENKSVPALRARLALEGFYTGDVSEEALKAPEANIYDEEIKSAVHLYHDAHQLQYDENKGIMKSFWESLNTPRKKRVAQIDENLRRWHNTHIIKSPYYIFINVPDFHGEVWRDGQRTYRFPVVTGNAKKGCSSETKTYYYMNATPLMHARMLYIEYNPYWIVPPRIEQEDYIEKINADPNWLMEHGFEYYTEKGHTVLRQLPSEKNALGRVKFIFPNPHSTFLHDSPQKHLFKYPIRAFSHGCMRVWEPLKLAKLLLQYDGQWYDDLEKEIDGIDAKTGKKAKAADGTDKPLEPRRFILKTRFDVFIDYFTVRVDDDGIVYFLADPYRYVKDALEPPSAKSQKCVPNPRVWIARGASAGADVGADATTE